MEEKDRQEQSIRNAMEQFGRLIREDFKRIEAIKQAPGRKDFKKQDHITDLLKQTCFACLLYTSPSPRDS